jgi:uncharacterized membrane protein
VLVVLAALGVGISAYLTWVHYGGLPLLCSGAGDCETVQASRFATLGDVPVALLGLGLYVALLTLAGWRLWAGPAVPTPVPLALFGLALAGTLYSLYLTYLELFVIRAICPWCVSSAVVLTTILVLTIGELLPAPGEASVHND